jgi:hypothetical protein
MWTLFQNDVPWIMSIMKKFLSIIVLQFDRSIQFAF